MKKNEIFLDLQHFMDYLRNINALKVVDTPVDPYLEIAEIHRRVIAAEGPALLFTHPKGSDFPIVTNLFGDPIRAMAAFGTRPKALIEDLVHFAETAFPPNLGKLWNARSLLKASLKLGTRSVRKGPILHQTQTSPRLDRLPALTTWVEDGGPFLTLPLVYTEHPDHGGHNLGMYRMQVFDATTTGMHWQIGKGGGFHYHAAEEKRQSLPVTTFLGGPPALTLAAVAPLPENVPELVLASLIAGAKIPLVQSDTGHPLIATAEFALSGKVPPKVRRPEGPFGDHYGYYSLQHPYPIFKVERLHHRKNAIFPATVVGKPRQEDFFIGDLLQELLSPLFPLVMPGVSDLWSYGETGYHSLSAAVVRDRYPREAMASAFRILGEGQLSLTKFLFLVDQPTDLKDFPALLERVLSRTQPETDLFVMANLSMDTLDYTGPQVNEGSKGVWLGLGEAIRDLPREFAPPCEPPRDLRSPRVYCGGCLVIGASTYEQDPAAGSRLAGHPAFADWPLIILVDDPHNAVASTMNFLWTTFTRFEPAADLLASQLEIHRGHLIRKPPILIDARMKPTYPAALEPDGDSAALVSRRWKEYFPDGKVEMGDSLHGHLAPE